MINEKELNISNESYVKKDFYQIYPEILEIASKISERWDPSSSNESDPGVVLLKLLAFIADKNNYIIDKSILEAFMPSATQEDSMRKLCDMMGYEMKYYNSATTEVTFSYYGQSDENGNDKLQEGYYFTIPAFSVLTSSSDEDDIYYTIINPVTIDRDNKEASIEAIEGQIQDLLVGTSDKVVLSNLDNGKLYLPETQIAENGIFITNVGEENRWAKVNNLNISLPGSKVYKFGFDSRKQLPYILFPNDIDELIGNGLNIKYIRTKGINGNINFKTLAKFDNITSLDILDANGNKVDELSLNTDEDMKSLGINNPNASTNGRDIESIDDAYNGFKKTVGTFDTLVTCRDYANAIYRLTDSLNNPIVSNAQVADVRNHLTRSNKVVTYNEFGLNTEFEVEKDSNNKPLIDSFDLYIYPLGSNYSFYNKENYVNSFKPGMENEATIESKLEEYKTISHIFKSPDALNKELYCYKGYYDLNARITTRYKVTEAEESEILANIYYALYEGFNARKVDFGEEIPYDTILNTIKKADSRIKDVSLDEPDVTLKYMLADGSEDDLLTVRYDSLTNDPLPRTEYLRMLAKNILAGKISLFKYNTNFKFDYGQSSATFYGNGMGSISKVKYLKTELEIPSNVTNYELRENEVVQFLSPSLSTEITYPAYVNYYLVLGNGGSATPVVIPNFISLGTFANSTDWRNAYDNAVATTGFGLYKVSSTNLLTPENGFRVQNYTKYIPTNEYSSTITYFKLGLDSTNHYSEGKSAGVPYIPANSEYKLQSGDILYINYTDTNDVVQNIKYTDTGRIVNGVPDSDYDKTIIRTNFDMPDSLKYKNSDSSIKWRKENDLPAELAGKGMFSLGSNEQIEIRDFVETTIKNKSIYAYWQLNSHEDDIPFDANGEYILKDNEYFMYTDQKKTGLVILGSGTKLKITNMSSSLFVLPKPNSIKMEDVSSEGLGAFNDDSWCVLKIYNTSALSFREMITITLSEGDMLMSIDVDDDLGNGFQEVRDAIYAFASGSQESLPDISTLGESWLVRSRLDLNVGPNNPQLVSNDTDVSSHQINQNVIINPGIDDVQVMNYIKTNELIQLPGGDSIDVRIFVPNEETEDPDDLKEVDTFAIMSYEEDEPSYYIGGISYNLQTGDIDNNYTVLPTVDLSGSSITSYSLPLTIPSNSFGLIMIYYKPELTPLATLTSDGFTLGWYNDTAAFSGTLKAGINIIKVSGSGTYLTISRNSDTKGTIIISNPSIVEGINKDFLGLHEPVLPLESDSLLEEDALLEMLKPYNDLFFYNNPIDGSTSIDVDRMDEVKSMYDYNNVCNDFIISELNANSFTKGIKIAKSSRK